MLTLPQFLVGFAQLPQASFTASVMGEISGISLRCLKWSAKGGRLENARFLRRLEHRSSHPRAARLGSFLRRLNDASKHSPLPEEVGGDVVRLVARECGDERRQGGSENGVGLIQLS